MASNTITAVRERFPMYRDVPDDELTVAIGQKYPVYLEQDATLKADFDRVVTARRDVARPVQRQMFPQLAVGGGSPAYLPAPGTTTAAQSMEDTARLGEGVARAVDVFGAAQRAGEVLAKTGAAARGLAVDVMAGNVLPRGGRGLMPNLENTAAAIGGEELHGEAGLTTVQRGLADAARAVPSIAAGMGLSAAGVPAPLAFGAVMGAEALGETGDIGQAAVAGATGAVVPGVAAAGRAAAARALGQAIEAGLLSGNRTLAQKGVEALAAQGGLQVFFEGLNLPQYAMMSPEQRREAITRSVVANTALLGLDVPAVFGRGPSVTQANRAARPMGVQAGEVAGRALGDQVAQTELPFDVLRDAVDDFVVRAAGPVPERPESVVEQLRLTADPRSSRSVTLVTPGEVAPEAMPDGLESLETPHGVAVWNPQKTTAEAVAAAGSAKDFDGTLLGMSQAAKPIEGDTVVVQTVRGGTPVLDEVVPNDPAAVAQALAAHADAVPDGTSRVRRALDVLRERMMIEPGRGPGAEAEVGAGAGAGSPGEAPAVAGGELPAGKGLSGREGPAMVSKRAETITGFNEGKASEMPADPGGSPGRRAAVGAGNEDAGGKGLKGRRGPKQDASPRKQRGRHVGEERPWDILDWMEDNRVKVRGLKRAREGEQGYYGETYKGFLKTSYGRRFVSNSGNARSWDEVADDARRDGVLRQDASVDDFQEALTQAVQARRAQKGQRSREQQELDEQAAKQVDFEQAAKQGRRAKGEPKAGPAVPVTELVEGDEFTLAGAQVRVKELVWDPESLDLAYVVLEDGKRFEVKTVGSDQVIYPDAGSMSSKAPEDPWGPEVGRADVEGEAPAGKGRAAEVEAGRGDDPFAMDAPESVEQQKARQAAEAAAAARKAQQDEIERRQAAPLSGSSADVGQGNLFDEGADLFSGPSAESRARGKQSGSETLAAPMSATLPRRVDPVPYVTPAGAPVGLADIRRALSAALDIPVRARGYTQRALGLFRTRPETIRLRAINDIPVLAHEVGHYLHQLLFATGDWGRAFDSELLALGQRTSRPSYSQARVRQEGVAEFVREWMTDRARALAAAPRFTPMFEHAVRNQFPEVWDILSRARSDLARYINQPSQAKIRSMISREPENTRKPLMDRLEGLYSDWVNDLRPMERAMDRLIAFGLPANLGNRVTALAVNHIAGWRGKAEYDSKYRQIDLDGNEVGPSLREILSGVESLADLGDYMVARRALELNARGIQTGIDSADAANVTRRLNGRYAGVFQALRQYQRNSLDLLVQGGLLNRSQVAAMEADNRDYVPFYRVMEDISGDRAGGPNTGTGFVNVGQGVRQIRGSDRVIIDPLESILKNAYAFRELAERNRVAREFANAVERTQGGGRIAEHIARRVTPTTVPHERVIEALERAGISTAGMNQAGIDLTFRLWQAGRKQSSPEEGIFTVWRDGRQANYQVSDPDLYRALTLADSTDARMFGRFPGATLLRGFTRVLRAGATLSPEFMARNPFRDTITAGVYSRHGFVPFWDGFRGVLHVLGRDRWYQDWVRHGGRYSDFVNMDRTDLRAALEDVVRSPSALREALELANPRNVIRNLQRASEIMEAATRVSEYRRAVQAGAQPLEAANAAKSITLNFNRGGFKGKALNQLIAFFNAGMQDFDMNVRMHRERPIQTMAKAALYISAPSALLWWLGKDDEAIQNLPEWRKNFFWNLRAGEHVLSFPKPFLLGQLYGSSIERGLDYAYGRDPNAVRKWFSGVIEATPINVGNMLPTGLKPLVETWANKSMYRNEPLESVGQQALMPAERTTPRSSLVAQTLSRALPEEVAISPIKLDNLARGYLGSLGKYGTDVIDWAMVKSRLADVPPPPAKGVAEWPVARAFVNSPYQANAWVGRFYSASESVEQLMATARKMPLILEAKEQRAFVERNRERLIYYLAFAGEMRAAREGLSDITRAMDVVARDRQMTPERKRQRLIELVAARNALAELAFKRLHPDDRARFR